MAIAAPEAPPLPDTDAEPARVIRRRRSLPSGRAVLGGFLVAVAIVGVFAVATAGDDGPSTSYVVLRADIDQGARIDPDDLSLVPLELTTPVAGQAFTSTDGLVGSVTLGPLVEGQLLAPTDIAAPDALDDAPDQASNELSFPIAGDHAPRRLARGDRVALLATFGSGRDAVTRVIVTDATVVAVDVGDDVLGSSADAILTVLLADPNEVVAAAHAAHVAELTVVATTRAGDSELPSAFATDATGADRVVDVAPLPRRPAGER